MFRTIFAGLVWIAIAAAGPAQALVLPIDAAVALRTAGLEACTPAPTGFGAFPLGLGRALAAPRADVEFIDL